MCHAGDGENRQRQRNPHRLNYPFTISPMQMLDTGIQQKIAQHGCDQCQAKSTRRTDLTCAISNDAACECDRRTDQQETYFNAQLMRSQHGNGTTNDHGGKYAKSSDAGHRVGMHLLNTIQIDVQTSPMKVSMTNYQQRKDCRNDEANKER